MQRIARAALLAGGLFAPLAPATAALIELNDWAFNIDGTIDSFVAGDPLPGSGSLDGSGLGRLSFAFTDPGPHTFIAWLDHEIDEPANTFFNEYGTTGGALAAGQSWEIDEPGFLFGDIYTNVLGGSLDGTNGVPASFPDDVSLALGWDFTLDAGETATVSLTVAETLGTGGFHLSQVDADSGAALFAWSELSIRGGPAPVPAPPTMLLMGGVLALLAGAARYRPHPRR